MNSYMHFFVDADCNEVLNATKLARRINAFEQGSIAAAELFDVPALDILKLVHDHEYRIIPVGLFDTGSVVLHFVNGFYRTLERANVATPLVRESVVNVRYVMTIGFLTTSNVECWDDSETAQTTIREIKKTYDFNEWASVGLRMLQEKYT